MFWTCRSADRDLALSPNNAKEQFQKINEAYEVLQDPNKKKIVTVGMTGNKKGRMNKLCDHIIEINSSETPKIQEGHLIVGHIICQLIESKLFK